MNPVDLRHIPVRPTNPFARWRTPLHYVLVGLFVAGVLLTWLRLWSSTELFGHARWPDGFVLVVAAATTVASLSRQLPAQNVVLAALGIGLFGGAVHALGAVTGVPFGPFVFNTAAIGQLLFYPLPWPVPIIWVVALLTSRGVARLILRRFRHRPYYGLWVLALTALLVVVLELSFEPYATQVRHYWSWKPTRIPSDWYTTPWTNFLGWAVSALLILSFVTPALINKRPVTRPPQYHPLLVWELLSILFLTGVGLRHLWPAAFLTLVQMVTVAALSLLGAAKESSRNGKRARPAQPSQACR